MRQYHIFISGDVQGVGFRAFIKRRAVESKLKGFVRNNSEGKVEILVQGNTKKLKEFLEICKKGPLGSDVEDIEVNEENIEEDFEDFNIIQ